MSSSASYDSDEGHSTSDGGFAFSQIAAVLLIGYLIYRWYASSSLSASTQSSTASRTAAPRRLSPLEQQHYEQKAEVVHGMFPQVPMNAIKWELLQNGGSVEITTEKILANGFLREPPTQEAAAAFTSGVALNSSTPTSRIRTPTSPSSSSIQPKTNPQADLITRYSLQAKLASYVPSSDEDLSASKKTGKSTLWSQNKTERQTLLQKRRDEMILKARKRLEEEDRKKKGGTAASSS